ncbi:hypothetical protein PhCBS80983_g01402 [Powellomyces hirtus]|uniref:Uncharacterized protein n=1 Tax=Powellomyces hirtus TaxID=109895 RepID=A0A507EBA8_9FUNG|nr:hypothetical protein PhCBS80983_g01402 [Powellomyces hirtus]
MGVGGKTVPIAALRDWDSESLSLGIGSNPTIEDEFLRRPSVDSIASVEAGDPADAEASKLYAGLSEEQKAEVISLTYEDMLFECALEIAFEAHREEKLARSPKLEPVIPSSSLAISPYLGDLPDVDLQPSLGYLPAMDFIVDIDGDADGDADPDADADADGDADADADAIGSEDEWQ